MLQKIFKNISEWSEDRLRRLTGPLNPDTRVIVIVCMLLVFSGLSIYITISSIYNMGKEKGVQIQIEHIERLQLQQKSDSINHLKLNHYE